MIAVEAPASGDAALPATGARGARNSRAAGRPILGRLVAGLANGLLLAFAVTAIYPLVWVLYNSLKSSTEFAQNIFALPSAPTLDAYQRIIAAGHVFDAVGNSVLSSVAATAIIVVAAYVIAFVLARFDFRGRRVVQLLLVLGLLLPIPALLVPVFLQYRSFGLLDSRFTLILPYVAFNLSLAVFLLESYIRKVPVELDEAAYIDGASLPAVMFRIIFPICRPMLVTVGLLSFLHIWNEFPFAMTLVRSQHLMTIPVWLRTFSGQYTTDYPGMMAGMVVASLPVVILYLMFREKIVDGFAGGAMKS